MFLIAIIISAILSYLIGSIPTGFILARVFKGVDIRRLGSGNVGATNVLRVTGKLPGALTLIIDILKGLFVVTMIAGYSYPFVEDVLYYDFYRVLLGFIAICGHIWSVFLRFKGGKGVATTIGVLIGVAPIALLMSLVAWLIVFFWTNYVSAASIVFGIILPIVSVMMNQSIYVTIFGILICLLNTYKHRDNIKRLIKGEETKTILFKNK